MSHASLRKNIYPFTVGFLYCKSCFVMKAFGDWIPYKFFKREGGGTEIIWNLCNNSLNPPSRTLGQSVPGKHVNTAQIALKQGEKTAASDKGPKDLECNTDAESSAKPQTAICFLKLCVFSFPPPPPPVRTRDIPRTLSSLAASRQLPRMLGHCL